MKFEKLKGDYLGKSKVGKIQIKSRPSAPLLHPLPLMKVESTWQEIEFLTLLPLKSVTKFPLISTEVGSDF